MWTMKESNSFRAPPPPSITDLLRAPLKSAAFLLISSPSGVSISSAMHCSIVVDVTTSRRRSQSLTRTPIPRNLVISTAFLGWSECIGQAAMGTPIDILSMHEFQPQWEMKPPVAGCARMSSCGAQSRTMIPLPRTLSSYPSGNWSELRPAEEFSSSPEKMSALSASLTENLLLDDNGNLKITDFGLSALAESKRQDGLLHTTCGTPAYVSPEVINRRGYDGAKADIWSCGVILYVLLSGYLPFHDSNLMEMYRKICQADFTYPKWFSSDACKLISKILDPNPNTRIPISKIMGTHWFRKGFNLKAVKPHEDTGLRDLEAKAAAAAASDDAIFDHCENANATAEAKQESSKLTNLNAFDIISFSSGFDLSGLFEGSDQKSESRFTSMQPAQTIITKLEDIARKLKLKLTKKDGGCLKLEGSKLGRKGVLSIDAEIFEVTPAFHLVEMKKSNGDTLEYRKMMKQEIRPALKDIAWIWQGDELQQPEQKEGQPADMHSCQIPPLAVN